MCERRDRGIILLGTSAYGGRGLCALVCELSKNVFVCFYNLPKALQVEDVQLGLLCRRYVYRFKSVQML